MTPRRLIAALVAVLAFASARAAAQATFDVVSLDDGGIATATRDVASLAIDAEGVRLDGQPAPSLLSAVRAGAIATPAPDGQWRLFLRNGEVLVGLPDGGDDAAIRMRTMYAGDVEVPLEQVAGLAAGSVAAGGVVGGEAPAADVVQLQNGDRVQGFFSGFDENAVTIEAEAGGEVAVPLASVRHLRLADLGGAAADDAAVARVVFAGGTALRASSVTIDFAADSLVVARGAHVWSGTAGELVAIEPLGTPVAWLAELTPAEATHVPYLSASSPPRSAGGLLATAGVPARSIVLRPRGRVAYAVPEGGWTRLSATIANGDATSGRADADVRVLVDGTTAFEHLNLTPADGEVAIDVLLDGAASVAIEVDYGRFLDVEDRVVIKDAVLLGPGDE